MNRWPECTKKKYSKREAQTMRNLRRKRAYGRKKQRREGKLFIYNCHYCGWWHLTQDRIHYSKGGGKYYNY